MFYKFFGKKTVLNSIQAAAYLAKCAPAYCQADFVNNDDVKSYIAVWINQIFFKYFLQTFLGWSDYIWRLWR